MIRKISHISITLLLVIVTAGIAVSKHYCGNTMVGVSLFADTATACAGDNSCTGNCCHNENQFFQIDETYTSPAVLDHVSFFQVHLALPYLPLIIPEIFKHDVAADFSQGEPPPLLLHTFLSFIQVYRL